jgi:hypothetical protein
MIEAAAHSSAELSTHPEVALTHGAVRAMVVRQRVIRQNELPAFDFLLAFLHHQRRVVTTQIDSKPACTHPTAKHSTAEHGRRLSRHLRRWPASGVKCFTSACRFGADLAVTAHVRVGAGGHDRELHRATPARAFELHFLAAIRQSAGSSRARGSGRGFGVGGGHDRRRHSGG